MTKIKKIESLIIAICLLGSTLASAKDGKEPPLEGPAQALAGCGTTYLRLKQTVRADRVRHVHAPETNASTGELTDFILHYGDNEGLGCNLMVKGNPDSINSFRPDGSPRSFKMKPDNIFASCGGNDLTNCSKDGVPNNFGFYKMQDQDSEVVSLTCTTSSSSVITTVAFKEALEKYFEIRFPDGEEAVECLLSRVGITRTPAALPKGSSVSNSHSKSLKEETTGRVAPATSTRSGVGN